MCVVRVEDGIRDHCVFFFFKQKTAYEMCGRDWSSDVCSSDLPVGDHLSHTRTLVAVLTVFAASARLRVASHLLPVAAPRRLALSPGKLSHPAPWRSSTAAVT